jgi:hypothetical protein
MEINKSNVHKLDLDFLKRIEKFENEIFDLIEIVHNQKNEEFLIDLFVITKNLEAVQLKLKQIIQTKKIIETETTNDTTNDTIN